MNILFIEVSVAEEAWRNRSAEVVYFIIIIEPGSRNVVSGVNLEFRISSF